MLTSLNLRNGIANTQILKDGLAADCAPTIGVVDNNLLVAYVRRGRIRSQLIRLPTSS